MFEAVVLSSYSKDPRKQVGCKIVDNERIELSSGYNGFPRGIKDTQENLQNRDKKLRMIIHAEENAICSAARKGHSLLGGIAFVTAHPCASCAGKLIQVGIRSVIYLEEKHSETKNWEEDYVLAKELFIEAGVLLLEVQRESIENTIRQYMLEYARS